MALAVPIRSIKSALALATEGRISGSLAKYRLFRSLLRRKMCLRCQACLCWFERAAWNAEMNADDENRTPSVVALQIDRTAYHFGFHP